MNLSKALASELQHEAATTRRCLERVPESAFDWKPHEKSFTMRRLAAHIAEMTQWINVTIEKPELDFAASDYKEFIPQTNAELIEFFDKNLAAAIESLKNTSDEALMENWKLRNGDQVFFEMPRAQALRAMVFNHIISHRGQLSVYLRMNDIPVPAMYGPSADEGIM